MECRKHCGACCIAPSINRPYYGMPSGKPAGEACGHLDLNTMQCRIWGTPHYPDTCRDFAPGEDTCGQNREEAIQILTVLEHSTR